jgi:hypothetical protein
MSSPTPVHQKRWIKLFFWPAVILLGLPAICLWIVFHMVAVNFACDCMPIAGPNWGGFVRGFGAIWTGVPLLIADWFVIWKYRDFKRKEKWAKKYTEEHAPWYVKTGDDRPKGPIKNKPYEP